MLEALSVFFALSAGFSAIAATIHASRLKPTALQLVRELQPTIKRLLRAQKQVYESLHNGVQPDGTVNLTSQSASLDWLKEASKNAAEAYSAVDSGELPASFVKHAEEAASVRAWSLVSAACAFFSGCLGLAI